MKYKIDLDSFCEEIFYAMEHISEGSNGHEFVMEAGDKDHATDLTTSLLSSFIFKQLKAMPEAE